MTLPERRRPAAIARPPSARRGSRYSRFVDLMRVLLPSIAAALIALVALWPQLNGGYGSLVMPMLAGTEVDDSEVMRMRSPRYVGQTREAEPYAVVAEEAFLDPARPNLIRLDRLAADITSPRRGDVRLVALSGTYHRAHEKLDLDGGIELTTGDGYRFLTESARVNLRQGRVIGGQPVAGTGPAGDLAADRFEIRDGGDLLLFNGRVKVTVLPDGGGSDDAR